MITHVKGSIYFAHDEFRPKKPQLLFAYAVSSCIRMQRKRKIYNAYALPIQTYNCGTWGLPDKEMSKLSAFHRRHLRAIANIRWPHRISSKALVKKLGTFELDSFVEKCRLRLFGHVLRLDRETPAQKSMDNYLIYFRPGKRTRGRPKHILPPRLQKDMQKRGLNFKCQRDLNQLRDLASDRDKWRADVVHRQ